MVKIRQGFVESCNEMLKQAPFQVAILTRMANLAKMVDVTKIRQALVKIKMSYQSLVKVQNS